MSYNVKIDDSDTEVTITSSCNLGYVFLGLQPRNAFGMAGYLYYFLAKLQFLLHGVHFTFFGVSIMFFAG